MLLSHKRNKIMPLAATRMQLETLVINESEKERQISYDITHIWDLLSAPMNLPAEKKLRDMKTFMVAKGQGSVMDGEFGVSRHKP